MASGVELPVGELMPADNVLVEEIGDDLCLLRMDTNDVLLLNRTASDIWVLLVEHSDVATVVSDLARAYGLPAAEIEDDVRSVVSEMLARGFVVPVR